MKNSKGFTIIEAIITAVIVAILAAIAVPFYNGYVTSARQDRVNNLSQTAAAAANAYVRKTGVNLTEGKSDIPKLNLFVPDSGDTIEIVSPSGLNGIIRVTDSKGTVGTATY
jgi:prepilin-type N-terminal cleavage/methylation domain-containing protein